MTGRNGRHDGLRCEPPGAQIAEGRPEAECVESFDPGRTDALRRLAERPTLREFNFYHLVRCKYYV